MKNVLCTVFFILVFSSICLRSQPDIWINEFHYDNSGTDVGEFVEIVAPENFSELTAVMLTEYNGGDNEPNGSHSLSTFVKGITNSGFVFYFKNISDLQNGAPDGFCLDYNGTVIQFISYEGEITATAGPAIGLTSTDIGVSESVSTPVGYSLQLTGNGTQYSDFTWASEAPETKGSPNSTGAGDQSLPVSLASFTVKAVKNQIILDWTTESEVNNLGFEIERALQAEGDYQLIAGYQTDDRLKGAVNSNARRTYSFADEWVTPGFTYWYKLADVDLDGNKTWHGPVSLFLNPSDTKIEAGPVIPDQFMIYPNYPNPFNPVTSITIEIPEVNSPDVVTSLKIYNTLGQEIKTILNEQIAPGNYTVTWDARDETGNILPAGIYYAVLRSRMFQKSIKMILAK